MRSFWDEKARENAAWYVDTTCDYENPDMERFFQVGPVVVEQALSDAPVQPKNRGTAVEIGPGLGRICAALADHFERVIGIDISAEMVERARRLVPDERVEFLVGDGITLMPIETASADFVITFTVLQHLTSKELVAGYLREAARVLAPGGVLAAQWNNLPHPTAWRLRAIWWRLRHRFGGPLRMDSRVERPFIGTRVPFRLVSSVLEQEGLTVRGTKSLGTLFSWVWAEKPVTSRDSPDA